MVYKSPAALEMAVKAAASASSLDTGRAISSFYFHRFLCRVFQDKNDMFVLKGGQAMLARTIDARATRDIDLLGLHDNLEDALEKLIDLGSTDLDDFITFEYIGSTPIKAEDEYRSGISVRFIPMLGAKRMQQISIDLVVDEVPLEEVELVRPVDRIEIEGLQNFDYLVYPVENALADKLCALIEMHDGRSSSRVKDLVDIVVYASTCEVDGEKLQSQIHREAAIRSISLGTTFEVPKDWNESHVWQYEKLATMTGLAEPLSTMDQAISLARGLLNPAINNEVASLSWKPLELRWNKSAGSIL